MGESEVGGWGRVRWEGGRVRSTWCAPSVRSTWCAPSVRSTWCAPSVRSTCGLLLFCILTCVANRPAFSPFTGNTSREGLFLGGKVKSSGRFFMVRATPITIPATCDSYHHCFHL